MNNDLKWCDYCGSWHSRPCGEGCCWLPTNPTLEQMGTVKGMKADLLALHDDTIRKVKDWVETK